MALHSTLVGHAPAISEDILRIVLVVGVVLLLMTVATVVFGWNGAAPSFDLNPDPLGALRF